MKFDVVTSLAMMIVGGAINFFLSVKMLSWLFNYTLPHINSIALLVVGFINVLGVAILTNFVGGRIDDEEIED